MERARGIVTWLLANRTPASIPARATIWAVACYSLIQGFGIIFGGPERWGGPSYSVIRQLPGSPYSWGATLALFGVMLVVSSLSQRKVTTDRGRIRLWWLKFFALLGFFIWSWLFGSGALTAAVMLPVVGTTGGPTYFLDAVVAAILITLDEGRRYEQPGTQLLR